MEGINFCLYVNLIRGNLLLQIAENDHLQIFDFENLKNEAVIDLSVSLLMDVRKKKLFFVFVQNLQDIFWRIFFYKVGKG